MAGTAAERSPWQWRRLIADPRHGPLPGLLLLLTMLTGVVDAVSILRLGRVFVANMTGNVVFVGFALGGAPGFSLAASLIALAGFLFGAAAGGAAAGARSGWTAGHRGRLLFAGVGTELTLLTAALVVALSSGSALPAASRDVLAALLAVAMGVQNAVARRLAVPDLTTTVLTMTLTGIAADWRTDRSAVPVRLLAVAMMVLGAVCGALLVGHAGVAAALGLATGLSAVATAGAAFAARMPGLRSG